MRKKGLYTVLLNIRLHEAFLSLLLDLREEAIFFPLVVVGDHLVPTQAVANEVLVVFWLDVRSLEVDAGFC